MEDKELINTNNEDIKSLIYTIRGKQVMLDSDIAIQYKVETKKVNEAVKRNHKRFPEEFCFQLNDEEYKSLRSQFVTLEIYGRGHIVDIIRKAQNKILMIDCIIKGFRKKVFWD